MGRIAGLELSNNEFNVFDELVKFALPLLYPEDKDTWYNESNFYASVGKILGGINQNTVNNQIYLKTVALKNGKKRKISEKSFDYFCGQVEIALAKLSQEQLLDYRNVKTLYDNFGARIKRRFKNEYFQLSQNEIREENFQFLLSNYLSDRVLESNFVRFGTYFLIIFPKIPLENICILYDYHSKKNWICRTKYFEGILDITYKDDKSDCYISFQIDCLRNILYDHSEYVGNLIATGTDCPYYMEATHIKPIKVVFTRQAGKISKEIDFFSDLNLLLNK